MQVVGFWWDTSWAWILFIIGTARPSSSSFIITEDNNPIITEGGNNLITE